MKKVAKIYSLIVTMLFSFFCFAGCDLFQSGNQNGYTQLSTPNKPVVSVVNGSLICETEEVENATAYQLLVNGVPYNSATPYFNCSGCLIGAGEYKFKIVALGTGSFLNSKYSAETVYTHIEQLSAPKLSLVDNVLKWSSDNNSTDFDVYVNNQVVLTTQANEIALNESQMVEATANAGKYDIYVQAKASGFYTQSDISNIVEYKVSKKIATPTELKITENQGVKILKWNSVSNAESYKVFVNGVELNFEEPLTSNSLDVSSLITNPISYAFKVQAIVDTEFLLPSELSSEYTYVNKIKLTAPEIASSLSDLTVNLNWQAVENAKTYSIFINNEEYERKVWATELTDINVTIQKSYLTSFSKPLNFKVKANGYENYIESDFSNTEVITGYGKLGIPSNIEIEKNNQKVELSFGAVVNAESYTIVIDDTHIRTTKATLVDLSDIITDAKVYKVKIRSNATNLFEASDYSEVVEFANMGSLVSPKNVKIEISSNTANITWSEVENATSYTLEITYYNGETTRSFKVSDLVVNFYDYKLEQGGRYGVTVIANGNEYYNNSEQSEIVYKEYRTKLNAPTGLNVENVDGVLNVSWNTVTLARAYVLVVNVNDTENSYELKDNKYSLILAANNEGLYIFSVIAVAPEEGYYYNSDKSVSVSYLYGEVKNDTTFYFNGKENSYTIQSQEQFNTAINYATINRKPSIELNICFDYTEDLKSEHYFSEIQDSVSQYFQSDATIRNELITAIYSHRRDMCGLSGIPGFIRTDSKFTFFFNYASETGNPSLSSTQIIKDKNAKFTPYSVEQLGLTKRTNTFDAFFIETLIDSVEVSNSDQLAQLLSYPNRKPAFTADSSAENIYNKAKTVLREIISNDMTDSQKVAAIYEYLVYNVTIDDALLDLKDVNKHDYYSYYAEGVFEYKIALSDGFAKAFTILCGIEGIETRIIYGGFKETESSTAINHTWNKVKIGGNWYIVDSSKGTMIYQESEYLNHYKTFLKTDEQATEYIEYSLEMPKAIETYNYYQETNIVNEYDLYIESEQEIISIIQELYTKGRQGIEVEIAEGFNVQNLFMELQSSINANYFNEGSYYFIYVM